VNGETKNTIITVKIIFRIMFGHALAGVFGSTKNLKSLEFINTVCPPRLLRLYGFDIINANMKRKKESQIEDVYEFSVDRYDYIIDFLNKHLKEDVKLVEVGCGSGNILEYIGTKTNIKHLYGIDISEKALELARKRGVNTFHGSVIDAVFVSNVGIKFDCVILGAILHHLVGKNRRLSYIQSYKAIRNSTLLLKEKGYVFVIEPIFEPSFIGTLIFYIKKFVTNFTFKRVPVFGYWNNIGAPVVSYFSKSSLLKLVEHFRNLEIVGIYEKELQRNFLLKLFFVSKRTDLTLILKKK
jgi:SAM-dependent methyltransferase